MKMKQKLAATLAGVMAISMVPATSVFAYSANKVTRVVKGTTSGLNLWSSEATKTSIVFELTGELKKNDTFVLTNTKADFGDNSAYQNSSDWVYYKSGKTLQVKYVGEEPFKDKTLEVPIDIKKVSSEGDIVITVDGNGTAISSGEYVVGTVVAKGVTASLATAYLQEDKTSFGMGKLVLTENISGMFPTGNKYITLKLTNSDLSFKPFSEVDKNSTTVVGSTTDKYQVNFGGWSAGLGTTGLVDSGNIAYVSDDGMSLFIPVSLSDNTTSVGTLTIALDKITVYKNEDEDFLGNVNVKIMDGWVEDGKLITDSTIGLTEKTATILSNKEAAATIKPSGTVPTLVAGKLNDYNKDGAAYANADHKTVMIDIAETTLGSVEDEIVFKLPEGVKILSYDVAEGNKEGLDSIEVNGVVVSGPAEDEYTVTTSTIESAMSRIYNPELVVKIAPPTEGGTTSSTYNGADARTANTLLDIHLYLYLSVSADYEGDTVDIEYETTLSNGEKLEGSFTVANVEKPVEVSAVSTVIDSSLKRQELGEVTITENMAGGLTSGGYVYVELEEGVFFDEDKGSLKVTDGDIQISKLKYYTITDRTSDYYGEINKVGFYVDDASTKASTITISGLQTSTKNTAGGYYELSVYGNAIAANNIMLDSTQDLSSLTTDAKKEKAAKYSAEYFNAGTLVVEDYVAIDRELLDNNKAPEANNKVETVVVTIPDGSTKYTRADGTTGTMVAPTYRPVDGITMVSVRAIPEMLGADVEYSAESKTVTITMPDGKYAQVTLDSVVGIDINGRTVMMNYKAEIPEGKDGGIYVPLRYFGRLLGLADEDITYDTATKSVVISYDKIVK